MIEVTITIKDGPVLENMGEAVDISARVKHTGLTTDRQNDLFNHFNEAMKTALKDYATKSNATRLLLKEDPIQ